MTEYADHLHEHMKYPVCINKGSYQATQVSLMFKYCLVYFFVYKNTWTMQLTLSNPVADSGGTLAIGAPFPTWSNFFIFLQFLAKIWRCLWKILYPPMESIVAKKTQLIQNVLFHVCKTQTNAHTFQN